MRKNTFNILLVILNLSLCTATPLEACPIVHGSVGYVPQQEEKILVGLLNLTPRGIIEAEGLAISDRLRFYLNQQSIFQLIERENMRDILNEQGFQLTGVCDTDECVIQVGKILGARKMVAGAVSKVGSIYVLQIRIVDIETSRIEHEVFKDEEGGIERVLQVATREVAEQLAQEVARRLRMGTLSAPSQLTATTVGPSKITLSWVDNSNESGFRIERKTGVEGTYIQISTVGANVTSYSDTELTDATEYYYRIRAYNQFVDSGASNEVSSVHQ